MCGKYYYRLFGKSAQGAGTWHAWCEKYVGARAVTRKYTNRAAQHIHKPKLKSAIGGGVPARAEEGTRRRRRSARYFPHTHTGHDERFVSANKVRRACRRRWSPTFIVRTRRGAGGRRERTRSAILCAARRSHRCCPWNAARRPSLASSRPSDLATLR